MCSLTFSGSGQQLGVRVGEVVSGSAGVVALRSMHCGSKMSEGQHHPPPQLLAHGRLVFHETGPWCQKGWKLLFYKILSPL